MWYMYQIMEDELRLCWRLNCARRRGNIIAVALEEEFDLCFGKAMLTPKQADALLRCKIYCIQLAYSTIIPILFKCVVRRAHGLHFAVRAVCLLFLKHLECSWFGIANKPLTKLKGCLQELEKKTGSV